MNKAIQNILDNPLVKAALFKQLVKVMKDNDIELITLSIKNEKMNVEAYQEKMIVMPKKDYTDIVLKAINKTQSQDE